MVVSVNNFKQITTKYRHKRFLIIVKFVNYIKLINNYCKIMPCNMRREFTLQTCL